MHPLRSYVVAPEYRYETNPTNPTSQELQVEPCDLTKRLASLEAAAAPIERGVLQQDETDETDEAIKVCTDFTADVRTITEVGGQLGKVRWVLCRNWIALNLVVELSNIYSIPFFWEITGNYKKIGPLQTTTNKPGKPETSGPWVLEGVWSGFIELLV